MLKTKLISKQYDGCTVLKRFSAEFPDGQVTAIVGPNGAGKTTVFDIISGSIFADSGEVLLDDVPITYLHPARRARAGIGRLYQDTRLFKNMPVIENMLVAWRPRQLTKSSLYHQGQSKVKSGRALKQQAEQLLSNWGLKDKAWCLAADLSQGQQKVVGLLRLILGNCTTLLLDEPTTGIFGEEVSRVGQHLRELAAIGKTVLLVEHRFDFVADFADSVYVLVGGEVVDRGEPKKVLPYQGISI